VTVLTPIEGPGDDEDKMSASRTRRCILSGEVLPEARLMRFVASPDGQVIPDVEAKLPGRGLWVRAEKAAIVAAIKRQAFSRAAKAQMKAPPDLVTQAETRLVERIQDYLGLARRAGDLILGFDQVERALRSGSPPPLIVEASDAAPDGTRKLQGAAIASGIAPFVLRALTNAELSLAVGRANVVHAALKSGRIAERLIFDAGRLAGFRPLPSWVWPGFQAGQSQAS
jgi:hypothetical protein